MKILSLAAVTVMAVAVTSCRKEEEVDLAYYPDYTVNFAIDGVEGNPSVITLNATYDGEGVLTANGDLTRTYIFSLDSPSPKDVLFELETIVEGLPAEFVQMSTDTLAIPAGSKSAVVEVAFTAEDFSFADTAAEVYELGVRVKSMEGFHTIFSGEPEAKVVVEKAAYQAEASIILDPSGANSINFKRSYVDGEIVNEDAMTFDFKAVLNRPALVDMEVPVSISGLPSGFESCAKFSEPTLKFAAGEKTSSNVITCDVADDFLLNGVEDPEAFALTVVADFSNYENGAMSESGALVANVTKALDLMTVATAADFASLEKYTSNNTWTATGDGSGTIGTMFDGVTTGYSDYYYFSYFIVDFKEVLPLNGFKVYCYYNSISYMPNHFTVEVSDDGQAWKAIGEVTDGRSGGHPAHVLFLKTINARYLKFTSLETSRYSTDFVEFELYHK